MSKAIPIILDTDIGDDVDDAYALVLAAKWEAVDLVAVTCAFGPTLSRARLASKLLGILGRGEVPVYAADDREGENGQLNWAAGHTYEAPSETAPEALVRLARERPGELTLVPIGPLSNVGRALELDPELGRRFKRIVLMGGLVDPSARPDFPQAEWNIRCDPAAARRVFQSGAELVMVGLDVTLQVRLEEPWMKRLEAADKPCTRALMELTALWGHGVPTLHDPLALSCVERQFCRMKPLRVEIADDGRTLVELGEANVMAAVEVDAEGFLDWYTATIVR
ncbi:MAG: nucleoside hydrolase [Armatimonadota bacterium]